MKEGLIPIGKMAAMNRVSVPTLRLYDEKELLKPRYIDPETGYRYYDINQNARLEMIAYMKEMRQLKAQHDAVERAILSIERYRKSPSTGTFSLEYIDRRFAWGIPCSYNFYQDDVHSYEKVLRELRLKLESEGFPQIHSYNIGTSILRENFLDGCFVADRIFIFTGDWNEGEPPSLQVVESGMYACIYLDNYDNEVRCAQLLREHCQEMNYHVSGDYICEVMTGFNVFDSDPRRMFLRLQVPVTFRK